MLHPLCAFAPSICFLAFGGIFALSKENSLFPRCPSLEPEYQQRAQRRASFVKSGFPAKATAARMVDRVGILRQSGDELKTDAAAAEKIRSGSRVAERSAGGAWRARRAGAALAAPMSAKTPNCSLARRQTRFLK